MGRVRFLRPQLCTPHLHAINLKVRRKRAACWASLRQVALLKLGLIANLTLFPWKQPAGQLVPVNLRPGGASAPGRLLANSLGVRREADLGTLLESLLLTFCYRSSV